MTTTYELTNGFTARRSITHPQQWSVFRDGDFFCMCGTLRQARELAADFKAA
jgi:hypothetical protein